ncbi:MAG: hypothetical protein ABEJ66_02090 [Candidatus Nanohaloarchaea archaeon]
MSISGRKLASIAIVLLAVPLAASQITGEGFYSGDRGISAGTGFSIPQYDSRKELVAEFVAPFLLIAILIQIGLNRALIFTLADDPPTVGALLGADPYKSEREKIRKRSLILSLVITGILVPTPFFRYINDVVAWIFGGMIYLVFALVGLTVLYIIYAVVA